MEIWYRGIDFNLEDFRKKLSGFEADAPSFAGFPK
jgi:hypothetical protein